MRLALSEAGGMTRQIVDRDTGAVVAEVYDCSAAAAVLVEAPQMARIIRSLLLGLEQNCHHDGRGMLANTIGEAQALLRRVNAARAGDAA